MTQARVTGLSGIELGVPDVAESANFYTEIWGLEQIAQLGGSVYLRGTGPRHHVLSLHSRTRTELLCLNLTASDRNAVDALHARVLASRAADVGTPGLIREPGGGYGFGFRDPEGRALRIVAEGALHDDATDSPDRPRKLTHVGLRSADPSLTLAFYIDVLGFRFTDRTPGMNFVRCGSDHHAIVFVDSSACTLDHVAFEMPDIDSVMRGVSRLRNCGYGLEWGVGRHRVGKSVFAYFVAPEGAVVGYAWDIEQVNDSRRVSSPDEWSHGRADLWGTAAPPSERLLAASQRITPG
jgi:catechol 2,3-dioxygenase